MITPQLEGNAKERLAATPEPVSANFRNSEEHLSIGRLLLKPGPSAIGVLKRLPMKDRRDLLCVLLAMITLVPFLQVVSFEFINFDDPSYVTANPHIRTGLTAENMRWAFTTLNGGTSYWHPLTWLTHQLDCEVYGLSPGAHHVTNALLHTMNTVLLFLVLLRYTGFLGRSAAVAALFALHPLHVESVAWVSERKDVLSGLFWFIGLYLYARYAARPSPWRYLQVCLAFVLGLMSKPSMVTFPCALLLLDFWPLKRLVCSECSPPLFVASSFRQCVVEKVPLFALSLAVGAVTIEAQKQIGTMASLARASIPDRLVIAVVGYLSYLANTIWPAHLYVPCVPPPNWPVWRVTLATVVLFVVTHAVISRGWRQPYLLVGWLWFLGTLLPMIGLLQVGAQAIADRYMYIPSVGLFVMAVWGVSETAKGLNKPVAQFLAIAASVACGICTDLQLQVWENSETLFTHAVAVNSRNPIAQANLGLALESRGCRREAVEHYAAALALSPTYAIPNFRVGSMLLRSNKLAEASVCFSRALAGGDSVPDHAHSGLALALDGLGQTRQAIAHYQEALRLNPDLPMANHNLAIIFATDPRSEFRHGIRAVELAQTACRLTERENPECLNALSAAYAESERFSDAMAAAGEARKAAKRSGDRRVLNRIEQRLRLYSDHKPVRREMPGASTNGLAGMFRE
jgi:Flp pilus assembly protein TadD